MTDILTESDMAGIFASETEISSANAYKIKVDFDNRFRIWKNEILPDRLRSIRMEHSVEFVHRMTDLLLNDGNRLANRARYEYIYGVDSVIKKIYDRVDDEITIYQTVIRRVITEGDNNNV